MEKEEKVESTLRRIFKDKIQDAGIDPVDSTSLRNDLDIDSLKTMEACIECENKLKIKIKNIEIIQCKTWGSLKSLVLSKMS